ncbi:MAG: tyrosine-type recombinase/integrase [Nitrospinota bacterium]|nr:tyrosine-type recombinase/integrase [Nitrospinota bacterium]MDP7579819.1 tyrosine-type recombinase/integrase [Nitrospinota bacterium]HJN01461.1 tyrosine-type recombinase/integrase [Nitrospinota bacterium]
MTVHNLRHTFASQLVQRGVDLYTVAALAGHRKISTTQRYAHLCPSRLRSAIKVLNSGHNLDTIAKNEQTKIS